jgi:integrase
MLSVAEREGWIKKNPFRSGEPLIRPGDERPRERILTREEEGRLLAACTGRRSHLQPIVIAALDSGLRRGELLGLRWEDVDLSRRTIHITARNSKTSRERTVAMTTRLAALVESLPVTGDRVFGIADNVKRSFKSVCRIADVDGIRFHDLRHTFASRLVRAGVPIAEVARALGHTTLTTTYRYVNADRETAERTARALDALYDAETEETTTSSKVN